MAETWYRVNPNDADAEEKISPVTVYKETPAYVYPHGNLTAREAKISSWYCYYRTKKLALEAIAERVATHRKTNLSYLREYETEVRREIRKMFAREHGFNKRLMKLRRELAKT
jgi:hypothetical protein